MTNSRRQPNSRKQKQDGKDWLLMILLFAFNVVSGYTTIAGAMKVLPSGWAWILGIFIQAMIFFALSEFILKHAPLRKWITVLLFTFLSVYTSFFTYYDTLYGNSDVKLEYNRAIAAHQELISQVYTPLETKLIKLKEKADELYGKYELECKVGLTTGLIGCGQKANKFLEQFNAKDKEAKSFEKNVIQPLKPVFNYNTKGLTPEEFYQKDLQALAKVPSEYQNDVKLDIFDYEDKEQEIGILTPYYKLGDVSTIVPTIIALIVDGISIMLGTAITIKRTKKSLITMLGDWVANMVINTKASINKILTASTLPVHNISELDNPNIPVAIIELTLRGKASEFLHTFQDHIKMSPPYSINFDKLSEHPNDTFQKEFRRLLRILKSRKFITHSLGSPWEVIENKYDVLMDWLDSEIFRQIEEEASKSKYHDEIGFSRKVTTADIKPEPVKVKLPN